MISEQELDARVNEQLTIKIGDLEKEVARLLRVETHHQGMLEAYKKMLKLIIEEIKDKGCRYD